MMEARRGTSENPTKSTSLSSRRNARLVVPPLQETVPLLQTGTQVHVVKRVPFPLDVRIECLVMTIGGGIETRMGSRSGTGTMIRRRIRIEVVNGGGMEIVTGIDGGKKTKASEGIEAGMVTATVVIQTNEIAQETDARDAVTRGIEHPSPR